MGTPRVRIGLLRSDGGLRGREKMEAKLFGGWGRHERESAYFDQMGVSEDGTKWKQSYLEAR
jgi:hypothetical protein